MKKSFQIMFISILAAQLLYAESFGTSEDGNGPGNVSTEALLKSYHSVFSYPTEVLVNRNCNLSDREFVLLGALYEKLAARAYAVELRLRGQVTKSRKRNFINEFVGPKSKDFYYQNVEGFKASQKNLNEKFLTYDKSSLEEVLNEVKKNKALRNCKVGTLTFSSFSRNALFMNPSVNKKFSQAAVTEGFSLLELLKIEDMNIESLESEHEFFIKKVILGDRRLGNNPYEATFDDYIWLLKNFFQVSMSVVDEALRKSQERVPMTFMTLDESGAEVIVSMKGFIEPQSLYSAISKDFRKSFLLFDETVINGLPVNFSVPSSVSGRNRVMLN